MLTISVVATLLIVIVTVLPLSKHPHWIIRGMDFPRLQIVFLAGVLLAVHFVFLDLDEVSVWLLISATALCFLWQLWWILPYTLIWPKEVHTCKTTDRLRQVSLAANSECNT